MARVYPPARFGDTVATPHEFNAWMNALGGAVAGGLDRENVFRLPTEQFAAGAWHTFEEYSDITFDTVPPPSTVAPPQWFPIPHSTGTYDMEIDCVNGVLCLYGSCGFGDTAATPTAIGATIGLFVDDELVGVSGIEPRGSTGIGAGINSAYTEAMVPVSSGIHIVSMRAMFRNLDGATFGRRILTAVNVRR